MGRGSNGNAGSGRPANSRGGAAASSKAMELMNDYIRRQHFESMSEEDKRYLATKIGAKDNDDFYNEVGIWMQKTAKSPALETILKNAPSGKDAGLSTDSEYMYKELRTPTLERMIKEQKGIMSAAPASSADYQRAQKVGKFLEDVIKWRKKYSLSIG